MRQFTRAEILERLGHKIANNQPIVMGGAGIGLIAKVADRAGIDAIMAYNTGPYRMDGHGSFAGYLAYGDSNTISLDLARHLLPVVQNTPVIGGIGAGDPYRYIPHFLTEMMAAGFSGIINVPTAGVYGGDMRHHIDHTGLGYPAEIDLIRLCRQRDIFSVAYVFTPEESAAMAEAGADVVCSHVQYTTGGMVAASAEVAPDLDEACARTEAMCRAARAVRPDVILLSHGGPFNDAESVQYCFDHTSVHGYVGASSIERIPVEKAITQVVKDFLGLRIDNRPRPERS
jgi:predicted TIM-barrel enzyme